MREWWSIFDILNFIETISHHCCVEKLKTASGATFIYLPTCLGMYLYLYVELDLEYELDFFLDNSIIRLGYS